jgi:membrane associated rhomboid family serine protease
MSVTVILIILTVMVSIAGFRNEKVINDLIFYPPAIIENNQYYRFITCGFIHADISHLFFNMYVLYAFGEGQAKNGTENIFLSVFGDYGRLLYILMYLLALIICLVPSFQKNKLNPNYRSLGASGAVSAVVFAYILFNPLQAVGIIFIPVFIPGFLFGIIYLVVSWLLDRKGGGSINHSAHIWGAIFGVIFFIVASKLFSGYPVLEHFVESVKNLDPRKIFTIY